MEGAPGAQGAALPGLRGATSVRGEYENKPSAQSHPGYPAEAYLTYGGFDWMTATVGGLWDALLVTVAGSSRPNFFGALPRLAHLDMIRGAVTGRPADPDTWRAPQTRVVQSVDVSRRTGTYTVRIPLGPVTAPGYVRVRGSDGHRHGAGLLGARVDPHGPIAHPPGDGDPWLDTWLYTNPIFIEVA
ncbi:hypothetical protein [Actinoplanes awajinensis]|nr:hypothetical protein [Actinoplanes awajinensis]